MSNLAGSVSITAAVGVAATLVVSAEDAGDTTEASDDALTEVEAFAVPSGRPPNKPREKAVNIVTATRPPVNIVN